MTDHQPPKLHRPVYWVWTAPEGTPTDADPDELTATRVTITAGDQLRAELEGKRHSLDAQTHPMHLSVLWIWAAMVRMGATDTKWPVFRETVATYQPEDDAQPDGAAVTPTEASTA